GEAARGPPPAWSPQPYPAAPCHSAWSSRRGHGKTPTCYRSPLRGNRRRTCESRRRSSRRGCCRRSGRAKDQGGCTNPLALLAPLGTLGTLIPCYPRRSIWLFGGFHDGKK